LELRHEVIRIVSMMVVAASALQADQGAAQGDPAEAIPSIRLGVVRFYRPGGSTRVRVFAEVPQRQLMADETGKLRYRVSVSVKDSAGLAIMSERWNQSAQRAPGAEYATGLEMLEFALAAPGVYHLTLAVQDSLGSWQDTAAADIVGYAARPVASDLVLTPALRVAGLGDTLPRGGEWRHGNMVLTAVARATATLSRPQLFYMLEAYSDQPDTATVGTQLVGEGGRILTQGHPRTLALDAGGAVVSGGVDLNGVPRGEYRLRVTVRSRTGESSREAPFVVRTAEAPAAAVSVGSVADWVSAMSEAQLDSLVAPLILIAESGEMAVYNKGLSLSAKAQFLTSFWRKRETSTEPGTARRDQFYGRLAEANRQFRESGRSATPGWRTDRGRIFVKYGTPDDTWKRPERGGQPSLEVWRFTKRNRYFIFAEQHRTGVYALMYSNEVHEPGLPGWQEAIGGFYAVQDLEQYLNVDLGYRGTSEPR
jgi:GWxTD domain-containing protein